MSVTTIVIGPVGSGKSSSIMPDEGLKHKGLNPKETVLISTTAKKPRIKGWSKLYSPLTNEGGNYLVLSDADKIISALKFIGENRKDIKNIVLDDFQYIMAFDFADRALVRGYDKFAEMAVNVLNIIKTMWGLRDDLDVFVLTHSEDIVTSDAIVHKMKTIGKMLDEKFTVEGLFDLVLYSKTEMSDDGIVRYLFVTNDDGEYKASTSHGVFNSLYIPNDMGIVKDAIAKYYRS